MERYVDADRLKRTFASGIRVYDGMCKIEDVMHNIENAPTANVAEVKHGKWIYNTDDFSPKIRCSVCGYNKPLVAGVGIEQEPNDYCNKCGAKMDGVRKEDV